MQLKTAIVTGSAGNLGRAVVQKFLKEHYGVIGTFRKNKSNTSGETNFEEVQLNLLNEDNCQQFVNDVVAKHQQIDAAILTAGGFTMGNIDDTHIKDIAGQCQLNFETAYNIARPVFEQMIKQNNGRIFLIGSQTGLDTSKANGVIAYGLSKSLLFRLAEILNAEAGDKNVMVHVIVPSTIDTPQNREAMPDADFSRWLLPENIADIIYSYAAKQDRVSAESVVEL